MIGFLFFVLLLVFFIIVMYRLFTINSEDRNVVLKTMTSGSGSSAPEEEDEADEASLRSSSLRSNILGSEMLKRSMWFGFGRSNKKESIDTSTPTNSEKVGVKGGFGDVVTKKEDDTNKGKESGIPTKEISKDFDKEVDPKPTEFKVVPVGKDELELKPKDLSTARDNTKEEDKKDDDKKDEDKKGEDKNGEGSINKISEEAKIKSVLGEGAISPLESPINKAIKREKLIPKISLLENTNELVDNNLMEKKSSHHKSRKHKSDLKKSHHRKSNHHNKTELKGDNMDLNTLLVSTKEAELH